MWSLRAQLDMYTKRIWISNKTEKNKKKKDGHKEELYRWRRPKLNRIQAHVRRLLIEAECCSSNGHMMSTLAGFWPHNSRHITKFTSIKRCMESAIICRVHHFHLFENALRRLTVAKVNRKRCPKQWFFLWMHPPLLLYRNTRFWRRHHRVVHAPEHDQSTKQQLQQQTKNIKTKKMQSISETIRWYT